MAPRVILPFVDVSLTCSWPSAFPPSTSEMEILLLLASLNTRAVSSPVTWIPGIMFTGASLIAVTSIVAVAEFRLKAVIPPCATMFQISPDAPWVWSHARNSIWLLPVKLASGTNLILSADDRRMAVPSPGSFICVHSSFA